jgi:hypothetical protein
MLDQGQVQEQAKLFTAHVDLGQLIITGLIGIVGWFVKTTIDDFKKKIDKHEGLFFSMNSDIQRIIGHLGVQGRTHFRKDDLINQSSREN